MLLVVTLFLSLSVSCPFLASSNLSLLLRPILSSFSFSLCPESSLLKELPSDHLQHQQKHNTSHESAFVLSFSCVLRFMFLTNYLRKQEVTWPPLFSQGVQHVSRFIMTTLCLNCHQPNQGTSNQPHRGINDDRSCGLSHRVLSFLTLCHCLCLLSSQPWLFSHFWSHTYPSGLVAGSATTVCSAPLFPQL